MKIVVPIDELPRAIGLGRRGRTFEATAKETVISAATLRRAERGEDVDLASLKAIARWLSCSILIEVNGHVGVEADDEPPIEENPDA